MKGYKRILLVSIAVYLIWVLLTYLLEGRLLTFLRPEATFDRFVYILLANFFVGTIVALMVVRSYLISGFAKLKQLGFRTFQNTIIAVIIGGVLGYALYFLQTPPTMDPIVLSNAFVQVLTVTIAEVMVCWVIIAGSIESITMKWGKYLSKLTAIVVASILFGVYHFAHSPPFNTVNMVIVLTLVGVVICVFYFIVRNFYGTIVFHNFMGVFGVVESLKASGNLSAYFQPIAPLFAMAIIAVLILLVIDLLFIRRNL